MERTRSSACQPRFKRMIAAFLNGRVRERTILRIPQPGATGDAAVLIFPNHVSRQELVWEWIVYRSIGVTVRRS